MKRDEVPRLARIVAVADVFDALMSDLTHKSLGSAERAAACIARERERQFDPECVDALLELSTQSLSDGLHACTA
jgi:HD-GYP domain-containing protein (c-di-GMP phosphodiesterase class II)